VGPKHVATTITVFAIHKLFIALSSTRCKSTMTFWNRLVIHFPLTTCSSERNATTDAHFIATHDCGRMSPRFHRNVTQQPLAIAYCWHHNMPPNVRTLVPETNCTEWAIRQWVCTRVATTCSETNWSGTNSTAKRHNKTDGIFAFVTALTITNGNEFPRRSSTGMSSLFFQYHSTH
jgi:hypothetical protein